MILHIIFGPQAVGSAWQKTYDQSRVEGLELWTHQLDMGQWANGRQFFMLASEMGTGKSLALLFCLHLIRPRESIGFIDISRKGVSSKDRKKKLEKAIRESEYDQLIVFTNYDVMRTNNQLRAYLHSLSWASISCDESHRIKGNNSVKSAREIRKLARDNPNSRRVCLSGTPTIKDSRDLWGQFTFLDPKIIGMPFGAWEQTVAIINPRVPHHKIGDRNQHIPQRMMQEHAFVCKTEDVLDLPDLSVQPINVELNSKNQTFYRQFSNEFIANIKDKVVTAANAAVKAGRCRQATSGVMKVDEEIVRIGDRTPDKILALEEMIVDLPSTDTPVVVFANYVGELQEVRVLARKLKRSYAEVSGSAPRDALTLQDFQRGDASIVGVNIGAGGEGIDLSRASYGFYLSLPWTHGAWVQSQKRLHRPGQSHPVHLYPLVVPRTIDTDIMTALRNQRNAAEFILEKYGA